MTQRRATRKNAVKQTVYARMAARAVGQVKKDEGHGLVATSIYCAKAIEDDDDDEEAIEKEEDRVGTPAPGDDDDLDAFEALFRPLSSSPTLRFVAIRRARSPFPPSLSLLSPASTPGRLTPDLLFPEPRLEFEPGYAHAHALSSPTISCASLGSCDTGSAPATPTTSHGFSFPFPGMRTVDETEAPPVTPRLHLRPNPRPRTQFRTLSASITARSPLSLSFPLSLSLPLSARRASSPASAMNRYMEEHCKQDEKGVDARARDGRDVARTAPAEEGEDVDGIVDGDDPFSTHGGAYYTPRARAALGFGDAYDLSAWAWACDHSPHRRAKRKLDEKRQIEQQQRDTHAGLATTATIPAFTVTDASIAVENTVMCGTKSGFWPVYHAPIYAASAPQLSCAKRPDKELESFRAMAKAAARRRIERPPVPVRPGPSTCDPHSHQRVPGYKSGIRPLLLPQKLGLSGSRMPEQARETDKTSNTLLSGGRERGPTGWERDLERGTSCEGDGAEA